MKKLILLAILTTPSVIQANNFIEEIPFKLIYSHDKKPETNFPDVHYSYIGSQIINGHVSYTHDGMYYSEFTFSVNDNDLDKLPNIAPFPKDKQISNFIINKHQGLQTPKERQDAASFYGIKTNMDSAIVKDYHCELGGPVQLQMTNIDFYIYDMEFDLTATAVQILKSGPFQTVCRDA